MLIAEVIIPQMFSAYAEDLGYLENGLHHFQYFCEQCDQAFTAGWGQKPGMLYWPKERGDYVHCPNCGTVHNKNIVYNHKREAPNKIRLCVKVYEKLVTFEVYTDTVEFRGLLRVFSGKRKEVFRFDISKQTVLFYGNSGGVDKEAIEIGNPFKLDVLDKSILQFFQSNCLANSQQKNELNRILRVLRETVHLKLEKHLGHKISSMYVCPGQYHGALLLPIFNIACRVTCPDAPNLLSVYRENQKNINAFWKLKAFTEDVDFMDEVIAMKRKTGFIPAMILVNKLPDTPYTRRALSKNPFDVALLNLAFKLCKNYDCAVRMFEGLQKLSLNNYCTINKNVINFLRLVKALYKNTGEDAITRLVENYQSLQLIDCTNLWLSLNKENRKAFKTEKVKLRDLHDWMSLRHKKQNHVNLKFDVPDHIVKRLSMQANRLKFFLPEESMQLLEAGVELHNCIASYGRAMKDNSKWIVLVADDNGKLAACLEVKDKELVQAKINKNKPVSVDPKLNAEVLEWAKKTKLKINTADLDVQTDKTLLRVALA